MLIKYLKGLVSANIIYPLAERIEKRAISVKLKEIKQYYQLPFRERKLIAQKKLVSMIQFAQQKVPYYKDLLKKIHFDTAKLAKDIAYLKDIPYLNKNIIREQKGRLFSDSLENVQHHVRKTGGSTGLACTLYYDQIALDYSAAITLYSRLSVHKKQHMSELHFACRFPTKPAFKDRVYENVKEWAMNRSNIFFDALHEEMLEEIWQTLKKRKPYLVHAHPSTIYALACYVHKKYGKVKGFTIFESSGELLEHYMRDKIAKTFNCKVVDRYGLAELGVVAYETHFLNKKLFVYDSEVWPENENSTEEASEIIFTSLRNQLMPLIRYRTGDLGLLQENSEGFMLSKMVGRIHDIVTINGINYATHYVQDILDRIGGIQEFQVDERCEKPKLLIVPEPYANKAEIQAKIMASFNNGFECVFVENKDLIRVGERAKFRHVIQLS